MPEFKLNGKTYSGSTNYASAITYTEDDGSKTTVQDKISELNSNFANSLEWKFFKELTNISIPCSLPSNFNELLVEIVDGTYGWVFNIHILKSQLKSGTVRNFYNGFHSGTTYMCATASVSLEQLATMLSGSSTSGTAKIYYR